MTPAHLRRIRYRLRLSLAAMARLMGLSASNGPDSMRKYETGARPISGPLARLATVADEIPAAVELLHSLDNRDNGPDSPSNEETSNETS